MMSEVTAAAHADYRARSERLRAQLVGQDVLGLAKPTSNLFRDRGGTRKRRLDVSEFTHVLEVNPTAGWVEAEGMITYEALVEACLRQAVMPTVVPELKTITLGGAAAGVGIEATSFRYGLVHETLLDMDVLVGDGSIRTAKPDNEHADLFFGFPNSYGTLGYALRLRARTLPVQPFVVVEHRRFARADVFFDALAQACASDADFVDAAVFGPDSLVLNLGRFSASAPFTSDYTFEHIYYRSLTERELDYLTTRDYIWRWDTDWFWCSKDLGAQNPIIRRLLGRKRLNSRWYTKVMRWNSRVGLTARLDRVSSWHRESVIQDVDIPIEQAPEFLAFYLREIGILPLWICPVGAVPDADRFPLFPRQKRLYVNFGFWDVKRTREPHPAGHFNRMIERQVVALGGIKSLYSDSYFERDEFVRLYGGEDYRALKARYDPAGRLGDLYAKCVLRQ